MTVFADSSALVKLYVPEEGSESVRSLDALAVAQVARVEVPSAIWRKQRMGELSARGARVLVAAFEADYYGTPGELPRFAPVTASDLVLDTAARLTGVHGLRAYDAVQLASARLLASVSPDPVTFLCFDKPLCDAAAAEGFDVA